ncbi:hypothetical protein HDU92_002161, partial [Lobulomyces angularis]
MHETLHIPPPAPLTRTISYSEYLSAWEGETLSNETETFVVEPAAPISDRLERLLNVLNQDGQIQINEINDSIGTNLVVERVPSNSRNSIQLNERHPFTIEDDIEIFELIPTDNTSQNTRNFVISNFNSVNIPSSNIDSVQSEVESISNYERCLNNLENSTSFDSLYVSPLSGFSTPVKDIVESLSISYPIASSFRVGFELEVNTLQDKILDVNGNLVDFLSPEFNLDVGPKDYQNMVEDFEKLNYIVNELKKVIPLCHVDYNVFTDAAIYVSKNQSPYKRETYRYTPLLAIILLPNVWLPIFGKLLFVLCDLLTGYIIMEILKIDKPSAINNQLMLTSIIWLLNPFVINISTRGSSESITTSLSLMSILLILKGNLKSGSIIFGLAVHFKIYPIIYSLPILCFLDVHYEKFTSFQKCRWGSEYNIQNLQKITDVKESIKQDKNDKIFFKSLVNENR